MSKIWSDERKFQIWLEIEVLACEAMAELCQIPKEDAAEIRKRARFSIPKILEIEKRTNHDVIAFLENVAESVGPASRWIHQGLTSSDILDTTLAVQLNQATRAIQDFSLVTLVPFAEKRGGKIGLYYLGNWPYERGGTPKTPSYANPTGFIQVTPQNADTYVSEHFRLRDFLTKDQPNVWPKYLLLNPNLLDKLELTIAELQGMGHPIRHVQVMSGFRTPNYNYTGGNTEGRANLSRHMYGDASDIFVDNDRNGVMDDLNGDGRVDVRDAEVISQAVDRVERKHPSLVGGVGVYSACCGHGPFTHIDVRGYRARWRGFGNG